MAHNATLCATETALGVFATIMVDAQWAVLTGITATCAISSATKHVRMIDVIGTSGTALNAEESVLIGCAVQQVSSVFFFLLPKNLVD